MQTPPDSYQLAGRRVQQAMYQQAATAKRNGKRVIVADAGSYEPDTLHGAADDCPNCGGLGYLALQVVDGGPFRDMPSGGAGWHNGSWWTMNTSMHRCPVCSGVREILL